MYWVICGVQLDQNKRAEETNTYKAASSKVKDNLSAKSLLGVSRDYNYQGGYQIKGVTDLQGNDLAHQINQTMMRVELPKSLSTGDKFQFLK